MGSLDLTGSGNIYRWFAAAVLLLALPLGFAIARSPLLASAMLAVALVGVACAVWPRFEVLMLGAYLLLQDPIQILVGGDTPAALAFKRADEFIILAVAAVALLGFATRKTLAHRHVLLTMIACVLPMLVSTAIQGRHWLPAGIDLVLVCKPFPLFVIGASIALDETHLEPLVRRLCWILTAILSLAFIFLAFPELQYQYLGSLDRVEERMGLRAAQGWFIGTSSYAWLAVATFCFSYASYLSYRRPAHLVQAVFSALCVTLTWRRKSMLAVAVILLLPLFVSRVRQTRWRVVLLGGLAIIGLVVAIWLKTIDMNL